MKKALQCLFGLAAAASLVLFLTSDASAGDGGAPPSGPACMTDSDCKGTPATPHCCFGSSCAPANVCVACVDYAGNPCVPLGCDGALCDTTIGSECSLGRGPGHRRGDNQALLGLFLFAVTLWLARRRVRRGFADALFAVVVFTPSFVAAEPEPAVDVVLHDELPPRRVMSIAWNPLPLILGKVSFDVIIVPVSHHALVLSPYYASTSTAAIYVFDDMGRATNLPEQTFAGGGGELGYRYYFGQRGPRGLFLGPSVLLGWFTATAQNGMQTPFLQYGVAADVGYQILIAERVSLSLGGGLQIATTNNPIPPQQFPAKIYANFGVLPRLLASIGAAF
jgi:hypothetical protein